MWTRLSGAMLSAAPRSSGACRTSHSHALVGHTVAATPAPATRMTTVSPRSFHSVHMKHAVEAAAAAAAATPMTRTHGSIALWGATIFGMRWRRAHFSGRLKQIMGADMQPKTVVLAKSDTVLMRLDAILAVLKWTRGGSTYLWAYTSDGTCVRLFDFSEGQVVDRAFSPWVWSNDFVPHDVDDAFFEDWDDNDDLFQVAFRCTAVQVLHCQHARDDDRDYPYQFVLADGERHNCFSALAPPKMAAAVLPDGEGPFPNMHMACSVLDDHWPCWSSTFRAADVECTTVHSEMVVQPDASAFVEVYMRCGECLRVFLSAGDRKACAQHFFRTGCKRGITLVHADGDDTESDTEQPSPSTAIGAFSPVWNLQVPSTPDTDGEPPNKRWRLTPTPAPPAVTRPLLPPQAPQESHFGLPEPATGTTRLDDAWGNFCGGQDDIACECTNGLMDPWTL